MNIESLKSKTFLTNAEVTDLAELIFSELSVTAIDSTMTTRQVAFRTKEWLRDEGLRQFADRWSLCLLLGKQLRLLKHASILEVKQILQDKYYDN
jgi:hypothetical protein